MIVKPVHEAWASNNSMGGSSFSHSEDRRWGVLRSSEPKIEHGCFFEDDRGSSSKMEGLLGRCTKGFLEDEEGGADKAMNKWEVQINQRQISYETV